MSHNLDLADEVPAQALVEQLGHHDWRMVEQAYRALVRAGQNGASRMFFEQVLRGDIGCAAYVVGSTEAGDAPLPYDTRSLWRHPRASAPANGGESCGFSWSFWWGVQ